MQLVLQAFLYALVQNQGAARGISQSLQYMEKAFNLSNIVYNKY